MHTLVASNSQLGFARGRIAASLIELGLANRHIQNVELVADELLATALAVEATVVHLYVEPFRLLTSVRVRCPSDVEISEEPFELRERVLQALTVAFGQRRNLDGSVDLWAEVPR